MDFEDIWYYLVLGAIYLVSQFLKKKKPQNRPAPPKPVQQPMSAQPQQSANPTSQAKPKKTMSFEDILKEFEKNLSGEPEEQFEKPKPVEQHIFSKPEPAVVKEPTHESRYKSYENVDYKAEQSKDNVEDEFSRNEKYKISAQKEHPYIQMLRDPNGAKNAIVLSEIINKKYF